MTRQIEFDIALSFAGEDRNYVDEVANILKLKGISVFYDKFEEANLWGKNLYEYLSDIYRNKALYTIMFISESYNNKMWTNHERQSMQSRAFQENQEYILPARFDKTEIPGLLSTIGYISLNDKSANDFCEVIFKKLVLSGRTIPSEQVRKSLSPLIKIPKIHPSNFKVVLKNEKGEPFIGADLFLIADNNTYLNNKTDNEGVATFVINTRRIYKLYFANPNYPAYIVEKIDPANDIEISVHSSENIGSIICNNTGYIPSLKGRLNPILDTSSRTYLYADNIAINGGEPQPVKFKVNDPMDLEDCDGMIMQVTIKDIQGRVSLIEFVKPIIEE
ncbi:TIR domain-containing protein [Aquiflexum sp.]|uniref:TIR domain-containing protein n=1 Tax=Aquiflexum sp. TaxID=1872584 RepID=UPI003593D815